MNSKDTTTKNLHELAALVFAATTRLNAIEYHASFIESAEKRVTEVLAETKVSAPLFLAAPKMLAALKAAESRLEYLNKKHPESIQTFNTLKEIKAAIAKAEGA